MQDLQSAMRVFNLIIKNFKRLENSNDRRYIINRLVEESKGLDQIISIQVRPGSIADRGNQAAQGIVGQAGEDDQPEISSQDTDLTPTAEAVEADGQTIPK